MFYYCGITYKNSISVVIAKIIDFLTADSYLILTFVSKNFVLKINLVSFHIHYRKI